jgi:hypothetical protein
VAPTSSSSSRRAEGATCQPLLLLPVLLHPLLQHLLPLLQLKHRRGDRLTISLLLLLLLLLLKQLLQLLLKLLVLLQLLLVLWRFKHGFLFCCCFQRRDKLPEQPCLFFIWCCD